jgi:3' terminal RNA ribose 2'-O-methyltransferase Hen1
VLIPVFDNQKHYFVGRDEYDKLLAKGASWLGDHPEQETIVRRYLKFQPSLARQAISKLNEESLLDAEQEVDSKTTSEEVVEKKTGLHALRLDLVCQRIIESGATSVIDLGCGEGKLIRRLMKATALKTIVGMDVAIRSLEIASSRLRIDELPSFQLDRVKLIHGSLMYRDSRFKGFDAAALVEVIEHLDEPRLTAMERVVFEFAKPGHVFVTTPNREYNEMWESLPAGKFRHPDHRFEWTREEFRVWADSICDRFGYSVNVEPVGEEQTNIGAPTQLAIFKQHAVQ